jgi:probable blue pigment (indigoidine) exporter
VRVIAAYIGVVAIWSTTPLAIQWSNSTLPFITAITLRMVLAMVLCLIVLAVLRKPLVNHRSDWRAFAVGGLGLFPNMLVVYWSAQHIPSGVMAVMLGITPFFVGVFSRVFLKENVFTLARLMALAVALAGLALIHSEQLLVGRSAVQGMLGMLCSSAMFALSSVWLKAVGGGIDPVRQGAGVLFAAAPCFAVVWLFTGAPLPAEIDAKSVAGVGYLVVAGSVLGGTLFFYVLRHCAVDKVSLITLITPVIALALGQVVADEQITWRSACGAALVVSALAVYQGVGRRALTRAWLRYRQMSRKSSPPAAQAQAGKIMNYTSGSALADKGGQ